MANTWTTTRSLHSGFKRSGADLVTTMTSYIDTSVLLKKIPLVKFIKLHPGIFTFLDILLLPEWFIFHNLTRNFGNFPPKFVGACVF